MERVESLLLDLKSVAEKELVSEPLTEDEVDAIDGMGKTFEQIIGSLGEAIVEVHGDPNQPGAWAITEIEGDPYNTAVVADVHTDGNTQRVLEVGSGNVDWIVVVHKLPDGRLGAAIGPIFSYYEFPHPMSDRLTDEAWRTLLEQSPPSRPEWTTVFYR